MPLNSREEFEQYASDISDKWSSRMGGKQWVVSVGISECSLARGADKTLAHLRLALEQSGLKVELRQVGCAGWCWAEPFVEVRGPDHPGVVYMNITTDRVPNLVAAIKRGDVIADWAMGVRDTKPFKGI